MLYVNKGFFDTTYWILDTCKWIRRDKGILSVYFRYPENNLITDNLEEISSLCKEETKYEYKPVTYKVVNKLVDYYKFDINICILKSLLLDIVNTTKTKTNDDIIYLIKTNNNVMFGADEDDMLMSECRVKVDGSTHFFKNRVQKQSLIDYLSDEHTAGEKIYITQGTLRNKYDIIIMHDDTDHYFLAIHQK